MDNIFIFIIFNLNFLLIYSKFVVNFIVISSIIFTLLKIIYFFRYSDIELKLIDPNLRICCLPYMILDTSFVAHCFA